MPQPPQRTTSPGLIPPITTPLEKDFNSWFTFATTLEASDINMTRIKKLELQLAADEAAQKKNTTEWGNDENLLDQVDRQCKEQELEMAY